MRGRIILGIPPVILKHLKMDPADMDNPTENQGTRISMIIMSTVIMEKGHQATVVQIILKALPIDNQDMIHLKTKNTVMMHTMTFAILERSRHEKQSRPGMQNILTEIVTMIKSIFALLDGKRINTQNINITTRKKTTVIKLIFTPPERKHLEDHIAMILSMNNRKKVIMIVLNSGGKRQGDQDGNIALRRKRMTIRETTNPTKRAPTHPKGRRRKRMAITLPTKIEPPERTPAHPKDHRKKENRSKHTRRERVMGELTMTSVIEESHIEDQLRCQSKSQRQRQRRNQTKTPKRALVELTTMSVKAAKERSESQRTMTRVFFNFLPLWLE
mmetsp:Transcript_21163/g.31972  ORF Transcript_21163/g.31972 Transcript_21163/m.31972 type:complete len:330 (+) Transcript_21163:272-1261(+)